MSKLISIREAARLIGIIRLRARFSGRKMEVHHLPAPFYWTSSLDTMNNLPLTRADARATNSKHYFTGAPCCHGHIEKRKTSNGHCVECDRISFQKWAKENPERLQMAWKKAYERTDKEKRKARSRDWVENNREAVRARRRENYAKNREATLDRLAEYKKSNPDARKASQKRSYEKHKPKYNQRVAERRTAQRIATPKWFSEFDELVELEAHSLKALRDACTGFRWHVDHMIPLRSKTACGLHVGPNLQVIPMALNLSKGNKLVFESPGEWVMAV